MKNIILLIVILLVHSSLIAQAYDPETGELVQSPDTTSFDPETGQPIIKESGQDTEGITLTEYELRQMIRNEMDQYFSNKFSGDLREIIQQENKQVKKDIKELKEKQNEEAPGRKLFRNIVGCCFAFFVLSILGSGF